MFCRHFFGSVFTDQMTVMHACHDRVRYAVNGIAAELILCRHARMYSMHACMLIAWTICYYHLRMCSFVQPVSMRIFYAMICMHDMIGY